VWEIGNRESLVATTMAKYKINLPYAVMSGADLSPLKELEHLCVTTNR